METNPITFDSSTVRWYALNAFGKVRYIMSYLRQRRIYCWAPFYEGDRETTGHIDHHLMPLVFFRATALQVHSIHSDPLAPVFIYPKVGAERWTPYDISPLHIKSFRTVNDADAVRSEYVADADNVVRRGRPVRVTGGMFKGMEGYVCRVRHDKKLFVHIPGICAVAVAYIPKNYLQFLDEQDGAPNFSPSEIAERERIALEISDRYNQLDFAASDPEKLRPLLTTEQVDGIVRHLDQLQQTCQQHKLSLRDLYLLFNPEEWRAVFAQ